MAADTAAVMSSVVPDDRARHLHRALQLVRFSILWGSAFGAVAIAVGVVDHSLGVFGVGLGVLADVAGSVAVAWRTRAEQTDPDAGDRAEAIASRIVMVALSVAAVVLVVGAIAAP